MYSNRASFQKQYLSKILENGTGKMYLIALMGKFIRTDGSVAMGTLLRHRINGANAIMCSINETFGKEGKVPNNYKRYVDDILNLLRTLPL